MASKTQHQTKNCSVAIFYHFFPHYRKGVIDEISNKVNAVFIGDPAGVEGIKPHCFGKEDIFKPAKCWYIGHFMFQPKTIKEAFGEYSTYIFLANPNHISTWIAAAICKARGRRVIFWGHGFKSSIKSRKNSLRKIFFQLSHSFYTYGWRAKQNAIELGFSEKNIYVGFNSLDYKTQISVRNRILETESNAIISKSDDELLITCISRLTHECRYDLLLDAVSIVHKTSPIRCRIILIGDGPERASLEEKANTLAINAEFIGAVYEENVIAARIFSADVTISPGKIGLTAMHSLMYGTPVISNNDFVSQMPEVEAVVPGFTGDFFETNDASSLAMVIRDFRSRFPDRRKTRKYCFDMIDGIYNPDKQIEVLLMAIDGIDAPKGDDAFTLFKDQSIQ